MIGFARTAEATSVQLLGGVQRVASADQREDKAKDFKSDLAGGINVGVGRSYFSISGEGRVVDLGHFRLPSSERDGSRFRLPIS